MRLAPATVLATALVLAGPAAAAVAGGSDAPTPYTVSAAGVTLPEGRTFAAHDHVNYRATSLDGGAESRFGLHLDPNNGHPGGAYIGTSTLDFRAAAERFPEGYCVTWVQVNGFDEHFGEGGQEPVCTTTPETPGTETPGTETPGTETPGTETPGTETPGTETPGTETPGTDTPETPGTETPGTQVPGTEVPRVDEPIAQETPAVTPDAPDDTTPVTDEVPVDDATPVENTVADDSDELASTGSSVGVLLAVGGLLALGGAGLLLWRRFRTA